MKSLVAFILLVAFMLFTACASRPAKTTQTPLPAVAAPLDVRDLVRDVFVTRSELPPTIAVQIADALVDEATTHDIDPLLLLAMIEVESQWKHTAVSQHGASGYLQLMPKTRAWMLKRETDLGSVIGEEQDVRLAVRYFAYISASFHRVNRALQAYNCGPACVTKRDLPKETIDYPHRVMALRNRYQKLVDETIPRTVASN